MARRNAPDHADPAALLPRERPILALAARARGLQSIARELGLSEATASERLARALRKLGFGSRAQLTRCLGFRDACNFEPSNAKDPCCASFETPLGSGGH
jgi:DNA-binding NarL/FixJ family response regulator